MPLKHFRGHPINKKIKTEHLRPVSSGILCVNANSSEGCTVRVLLDSGATRSFVHVSHTRDVKKSQCCKVTFKTGKGPLTSNLQARMHVLLPEFHGNRVIEYTYRILTDDVGYDVIMGLDLLKELRFVIDFGNETMEWDEAIVPFKAHDATLQTAMPIHDPPHVQAGMDRIENILQTTYGKADLEAVVAECTQLTSQQQQQLLRVLNKYGSLFDGALGTWEGSEVDLHLKPGVTPYHARPFPVPQAIEQKLHNECNRLVKLGVL